VRHTAKLLGAARRKMGGGPSSGVMRGWGGRSLSYHGDHLPPKDCSRVCAGQQHITISEDFSNRKDTVFKVKKLLNNGVDLVL
jgi:hypothetical protein